MSIAYFKQTAKDHLENRKQITINENEEIHLTKTEFNEIFRDYQTLQSIEAHLDYQHTQLVHNNLNIAIKIICVFIFTVLFFTIGGQ